MIDFIQHIINGLSQGSIYALIALGYTMVFGISPTHQFCSWRCIYVGCLHRALQRKMASFRREVLVWGSPSDYYYFHGRLRGCRICDRAACLPSTQKITSHQSTDYGRRGSTFLRVLGQAIFGANPQVFPEIYAPSGNWWIGGLKINPIQLLVFIISIVLMAILQYIIFKTRLGRAMRAVSFNHDLASLMGINTDRVISYTFMLGSALAGAAGVLVGLAIPKVEPLMGVMPGLKAFVSAVLGGIGNVTGAVVGALSMGLAEEMLVGYWSSNYRDALAFGILILVLLFKPTGLFGTNRTEKV